jgi:hypothetical protein
VLSNVHCQSPSVYKLAVVGCVMKMRPCGGEAADLAVIAAALKSEVEAAGTAGRSVMKVRP